MRINNVARALLTIGGLLALFMTLAWLGSAMNRPGPALPDNCGDSPICGCWHDKDAKYIACGYRDAP
jgi:hypothetical protein